MGIAKFVTKMLYYCIVHSVASAIDDGNSDSTFRTSIQSAVAAAAAAVALAA